MIEPHVAASLAERALDDEVLRPPNQATRDMEAALRVEDLTLWAQADDRYHQSLLELHGNDRLTVFVTQLYDQAHRARMVTLRIRDLPRKSTQEHRAILDAIRAGYAAGARAVFTAHRERAGRELISVLRNTGIRQI